MLSAGAAGKVREGLTVLSRVQFSRLSSGGRLSSNSDVAGALAWRPTKSDRTGLLLSYDHRAFYQEGGDGGLNGTYNFSAAAVSLTSQTPVGASQTTRGRLDTMSADGYWQPSRRLELYGKVAYRLSASGQPDVPFVSTATYLGQVRAQYKLGSHLDWAAELRDLFQPASSTSRRSYASEMGYWAMPNLRIALGYNFTSVSAPAGSFYNPVRRGFYLNLTSKLSGLFDLFEKPDGK
jgi:hypothetical protein